MTVFTDSKAGVAKIKNEHAKIGGSAIKDLVYQRANPRVDIIALSLFLILFSSSATLLTELYVAEHLRLTDHSYHFLFPTTILHQCFPHFSIHCI